MESQEKKIRWNSIYHKIDDFLSFNPLMLICENHLWILASLKYVKLDIQKFGWKYFFQNFETLLEFLESQC